MKLQLSEVVGHSDADRVLSVLEQYFRDESLEVIRAGDQLTVYGLGPSYRTMNHSDKTIVRVAPNHTGTVVDVDSHFLASALMGDMAQDTVVRSKVDRVFQRTREQLMAESLSASPMTGKTAPKPIAVTPVFPPSEGLPVRTPMETAEAVQKQPEQPEHAPSSEPQISQQKQPVREPDTQPVGTPVETPGKEPPVGEPAPESEPEDGPVREPRRTPFVETTPFAPVAKEMTISPLAGYAEARTTVEQARSSMTPAPPVAFAPKVIPGLQTSIATAQEMKQPVSSGTISTTVGVPTVVPGLQPRAIAQSPKTKEAIASGTVPSIVPGLQPDGGKQPEIKKWAPSSATPPVAGAAPKAAPPQSKAAPANWSKVATTIATTPVAATSASTVSPPNAADPAIWVPSFLPEGETAKPERSGKRAAVAVIVLVLLAVAGYLTYQHRSAVENFFVPGSGEHVISTPSAASTSPPPIASSVSAPATAARPPAVQLPQDVKDWVKAWAAALRTRDARAQVSFYADPVDRYLLNSNVDKGQLLKDKQAEIEKREGSWTVDAEDVVVASQTASDAVVRLTKHITQEAPPGIIREWHIRTQLKLKRIDGNWKITAEQTLA